MTSRSGLTLVELMVALFILVVGILAAVGLQGTALRGTRSAVIAQELNNYAESELQIQREITRHSNTFVANQSCQIVVPQGFECFVDVRPCELHVSELVCGNSTVEHPAARQITVRVVGATNARFQASTVVY